MPSPSRVSVIIPAYNIAPYLAEAVESVLAQSYDDLELIVINNGSDDNTVEVLKPYMDRIRYDHLVENQGIAGAFNRGLEIAEGAYVTFIDGDDYYIDNNRTAEMVALLEQNPDVAIVNSGVHLVDEAGQHMSDSFPWEEIPEFDAAKWLMLLPFHLQATLIRREWLDRVGLFNSQFSAAAGHYIGMRLIAHGATMVWLKKPTVAHRVRADSISVRYMLQQVAAEHNSRLDLFALKTLPPQVKQLEAYVISGHGIWSAVRLLKNGYGDEDIRPYLESALRHASVSPTRHVVSLLTQLMSNLGDVALSDAQWNFIFSVVGAPRDLMNWWVRVWWVYADRLLPHPLTDEAMRRRAQDHFHKYDPAQAQTLAKTALAAEPWALSDQSLRQFAQDMGSDGFVRRAYWTLIQARPRQGGVRSTLQAVRGFLRG